MIVAVGVLLFSWGVIFGVIIGYECGARWGAWAHGWRK